MELGPVYLLLLGSLSLKKLWKYKPGETPGLPPADELLDQRYFINVDLSGYLLSGRCCIQQCETMRLSPHMFSGVHLAVAN